MYHTAVCNSNKSKQKQNGKKQKPKTKKNNAQIPRSMGMRGSRNCVAELARSVINPWVHAACIPDGSTGTGKFTQKSAATIITGSTGTTLGMAMNFESPNNSVFVDGSGTTGNMAYPPGSQWSPDTNASTINAFYSRIRPVSGAIRAYFTGNTTNDSGLLVVAQMPPSVLPSTLNGQGLIAIVQNAQWYKIVPLRNGAHAEWRPSDIDDQGVFAAPVSQTTLNSAAAVPRPWLLVQAFGAQTAGAATLAVEWIRNWEGTYRDPTFNPGGVSVTDVVPAEVGWYERARSLFNKVAPLGMLIGRSAVGMMATLHQPSTNLIQYKSGITIEELD